MLILRGREWMSLDITQVVVEVTWKESSDCGIWDVIWKGQVVIVERALDPHRLEVAILNLKCISQQAICSALFTPGFFIYQIWRLILIFIPEVCKSQEITFFLLTEQPLTQYRTEVDFIAVMAPLRLASPGLLDHAHSVWVLAAAQYVGFQQLEGTVGDGVVAGKSIHQVTQGLPISVLPLE